MRISVVIPAWNAAATLAETLDSVAAQIRPADQVVVVDDGSSDATAAIAEGHPLRPDLIRKAHSGAAATMNRGIEAATGDCLAMVDADDLWSPEKLRLQAASLDADAGVDAVLGHFASFVCPSVPAAEAGRFVLPPAPQPGWLSGTLLIRMTAWQRIGSFAEDLSNGFAIDWFDRARAAGVRFHMLDEVLLRRRLHPGSLAARSRGRDAAMLEIDHAAPAAGWSVTVKRLLPFMPQGTDNLLIQAAVAPPEQARQAWRDWAAQRSLDQASWAEVRMLPSIAARRGELDIAAELLPRMDGIRRLVWTRSQKQLLAARPALAQLAGHGLPPMLIKGAAMIATYPAMMGRRFLRDVDILVHPERVDEAIALIDRLGWRAPRYDTLEEASLLSLARTHALPLEGPDGGELDLHRTAMAPNFCHGDDDALWARAVPGRFLDLPCLMPAREDLLIAALEHSFRRDPDQILDWSLDAGRLIGDAGLDWNIVVEDTLRRSLAVPVEARLRYLGEQCGLAVPEPVLAALEPHGHDPVFVRECLANQFGGLGRQGDIKRALTAAQIRRAELHCAARPGGGQRPEAGRRQPEVSLLLGGRRIEVHLPDGDIRKVRVAVDASAAPTLDWRCRVHCGVIQLRRIAGGRSPLARLRRLWQGVIPIDRRLFAAQRTGVLALSVVTRARGAAPVPPFSVDCAAELRPDGVLAVRLRLRQSD